MQRIFVIVFIFILQFQSISFTVFAADSTSFNPVPIPVVAKGAGGVPVGTIIAWPVAQNPEDMENWLECNGQSVSQSVYPELFAIVGVQTPDLRGLFLRGVGGNAAPLGSTQEDSVGTHDHPLYTMFVDLGGGGWDGYAYSYATQAGGWATSLPSSGVETRPKNRTVRYFIRAQP